MAEKLPYLYMQSFPASRDMFFDIYFCPDRPVLPGGFSIGIIDPSAFGSCDRCQGHEFTRAVSPSKSVGLQPLQSKNFPCALIYAFTNLPIY